MRAPSRTPGVGDVARRARVLLVLAASLLAATAANPAQPSRTRSESTALPASIPIFPLNDVMLFPNVPRPLHVFEPRYREMLLHALVGDRIIGMVMLQPGYEPDYHGRPPVYSVGCAGVIGNVEELPDGRYNIVLHGLTKFRITSEDRSRAFRIADVEALSEELTEDERSSLRRHRPRLLKMLANVTSTEPEPTPEELSDEELVNGLAQYSRMAPRDRLDLLEREDALERAEALIELLQPR